MSAKNDSNVPNKNPHDTQFADLPETLPVFPLDGVLLLPRGHLPLNIFEQRYLDMVRDCMATPQRLIGMVQPNEHGLFDCGCAGRIVQFQETEDGRYLITLKGVSRFHIQSELHTGKRYRLIEANWKDFREDLHPAGSLGVNRAHLTSLLQTYLDMHDISIDWKLVTAVNDEKLMTCLSMICPFNSHEKQALLEAENCTARAKLFMNLLEMSVSGYQPRGSSH